MRPITNRTELRWALEDMGDAGRPLLEYISTVQEYSDYLRNQAEDALSEIRKAAKVLDRLGFERKDEDLDELSYDLDTAYSNLRYSVEEYDKCN